MFGSTFWFGLGPRRQQPDGEVPPPLPAREEREEVVWSADWRAGQRILVAEDNRVNQKMASMLLDKAGWEHEIAEDGGRAVELYEEKDFDLVLMDCQMPGTDGYEATRIIRERERETGGHVPIVAFTANVLEGDRENCLSVGMDDYVAKPVTAATLIGALDRWLSPQADARARR